jgi:predicted membrane metal-binding protein
MGQSAKGSSDRSFGLTFAVVFAVVAAWPWYFHDKPPYLWAVAVCLVLMAISVLRPRLLAPFNRVWLRFGLALHRIANPVIMALIYYGAMVPMGLIIKASGRDLLRLKSTPNVTSHWVRRDPPGPEPKSMSKQF